MTNRVTIEQGNPMPNDLNAIDQPTVHLIALTEACRAAGYHVRIFEHEDGYCCELRTARFGRRIRVEECFPDYTLFGGVLRKLSDDDLTVRKTVALYRLARQMRLTLHAIGKAASEC